MPTFIQNSHSFYDLQRLSFNDLKQACVQNNVVHSGNRWTNIKNILKNQLGEEDYKKFLNKVYLNFVNEEGVGRKQREKDLNALKKKELVEILKNLRIQSSGSKSDLVKRIMFFEFDKLILTISDQKKLVSKEITIIEPQYTYTPELATTVLRESDHVYSPKLLYKMWYFITPMDYVKHLLNLREIGFETSIYQHLDEALYESTLHTELMEWYLFIKDELSERGWVMEAFDYTTHVQTSVNNKYKEKESNMEIAAKIEETISKNSKTDCVICCCTVEKGEKCKRLKCKHKFHSECIDNWLKRELSCPVCRSSIV